MRKSILALLACLAVPAVVAADTVYTRDGKILRGSVTRNGNKVIVQTAEGKVELLEGQVLHITPSDTGGTASTPPTPPTPPTPQTPTTPEDPSGRRGRRRPRDPGAGPAQDPSAAKAPDPVVAASINAFPPPVKPRHKTFGLDGSDEPEPVLFMLMRNADTAGGAGAADVQQQIEQWRGMVHEQRRKVLSEWLTPKDFIRRREAYAKILQEARDAQREAREKQRKLTTGTGGVAYGTGGSSSTTKDDQLPETMVSKLLQAANTWGDPVIRTFLSGMVHMKTKNYTRAASTFRTCCAESPRVTGYYQGWAMAQTELKQHVQALAAYVQVVRLAPASRDAVEMLRTAMGSVPGGTINADVYKEAERLLAQYGESDRARSYVSASTRRNVTWLMPGNKSWRESWDSLPTPTCDRLSFRQALGVPVTHTALLVDEEVLRDAAEVHIQIAPECVVPAIVRRSSSYSRSSKKADLPPLALVAVEGYSFSPVSLVEDEKLTKLVVGQKMVSHVLPLYEEMGWEPRLATGRVEATPKDGPAKLSIRLSAGDVAAPVFSDRGDFAGFLAGKTDPKADGGGKDLFYPLSALEPLTKRAGQTARTYGGGGKAQRQTTPAVLPGKVFVIYATRAEEFK